MKLEMSRTKRNGHGSDAGHHLDFFLTNSLQHNSLHVSTQNMAPKGKGGDKGKTADKGAEKKGAQKGAQSINVRHILCEKHAKKEEALKKLNDGVAFNKVAEEYSEDKARAGETDPKAKVLGYPNKISGGSLGWKGKGALMPEFEKVAFELEISSIGSPKWAE
jgi:NIMA-interacting peptidyl-prolyl cis-trans isomerase 4